MLVFVNALCNSPDDLETRCELRGELERRGLGSAIQVIYLASKLLSTQLM
jgi:hypothetical protein